MVQISAQSDHFYFWTKKVGVAPNPFPFSLIPFFFPFPPFRGSSAMDGGHFNTSRPFTISGDQSIIVCIILAQNWYYHTTEVVYHTLDCSQVVEYLKHNLFESTTQACAIYFKGGILEKHLMDKVLENI